MIAYLSELLFSPNALPFSIALLLMAVIGVLEGVATLMGMGLSGLFDGIFPDLDVDQVADVEGGLPHAGIFTKALGWLHVGRVPVLVLVVVFLTFFGLSGLFVQHTARSLSGQMLPALIACLPAFLLALFMARALGGVLATVLPKDETAAVSFDSFIGKVATLGAATATSGNPAQAKLKDQHGQAHYVLVEPDVTGEALKNGTEVVLVRRAGARFFATSKASAATQKS